MTKLLKAELFRLTKEKSIIVGFFISLGLAILTAVLFKIIIATSVDNELVANYTGKLVFLSSLSPLNNFAIAIPIIIAIILLKDFNNGTIRNKIISGHTRLNIFIASWVSSCLLAALLFILNMVFSLVFAVLFIGYGSRLDLNEWLNILTIVGLGTLIFIALTTFIVVIAYIIKSTGLVMLSYFGGLVLMFIIVSVLSLTDTQPFVFIQSIIPANQLNELISNEVIDQKLIITILISAPLYIGLLLITGGYLFQKNDLK